MRKLALIAAIAALSACNQNKAEPAPAASESAAPAAVATAASMAGTYEYTYEGKATTTVAKDDGTYEDTQDGKVIESGKWTQADGQTCFDDTGANPPKCWTTTEPDSMGMFTATSTDGKTVLQIKKTA
jgi:hypothetical protein